MQGCGHSQGLHKSRPTWTTSTLGWSYDADWTRSNSTCSLRLALRTTESPVQQRQLSLDIAPPEVSPSSDWCQRWREGRSLWRHRSEGGFDARNYEAGWVNDRTAKAYVERNH